MLKWEDEVHWKEDDLSRRFLGGNMLPEDVQDQEAPMVLIGTDVVNLYPSLDIDQVVVEVGKAVLPKHPTHIFPEFRPSMEALPSTGQSHFSYSVTEKWTGPSKESKLGALYPGNDNIM